MGKKVIIAGAGLGGLTTALRLTTKGYQVEILEKYHQAGGRLNELKLDGFTFDVGPSFFSMSYEFDELFKSCNMENPLTYQQLDPLYVVNFAGSDKRYHIYKDLKKLAEEFKHIEPDFEAKARKYLDNAKAIFHDTEYKVVKRNFNGITDYLLSLASVPWKHAPRMFRSMWAELDKYFVSHEVKVIFSLVAFFLGDTPFATPAVYKLLNYTELEHDGYWNVKGGMYRITESLVNELERRGVKIHYNTEIVEVVADRSGVKAFVDQHGKEWTGDIFVSNSDAASFRGKILKRKKYSEERLDKMHWTLAPFTIYLGVRGKIDGLQHHNYFLGTNFEEYADQIFKLSVNPQKPYYYVNVSSKSNPECAPEGCENLFILCPVPDLRYKKSWKDEQELADTIIEDLGNRVGYDIKSNIIAQKIMSPEAWRDHFNLYRGSGLGLAHGLNQIGAFRPANKDEEYSNLYYVGASTIPGTGLPIVVISSKLVTERITHEH
ncbi:MAG: phytoene desaturase family protein [Flavobacteriales bacterium]|nr:phytoene desaturase family protein [Flavobacteriales bacterium]